MIKRQRILIISLTVLFIALLVAYITVIAPLTEAEPEETEAPVETAEGEGTTYQNRWLIFPQVEREEMQSIEVNNSYGTYTFYKDENGDFVIKGFENLAYDENQFSQLVVSTGYTMSAHKLTESVTEQELLDYGFTGEGVDPAYYILTTTSGVRHKVTIGKKIISGGGYYAMYEGRDTVYVLDYSLEKVLLVPITSMVSPVLTAGIKTTAYYFIDNFSIQHYGKDFLSCRNLTSAELAEMETTAVAKPIVVYPAEYSLSTMYDQTLQKLCYYSGESVAALGLSDENLEKFGLTDAPYKISYDYEGYTYTLTASEPTEGYYYVATSLFNIIIKVPAADFEFLSWDLLKWIDPFVFQRNITYVKSVSIESPEASETFRLTHYPDKTDNLVVVGDKNGEVDNVKNFRELYKDILLISIEDYAPEDEAERDEIIADEDNLLLRITVTTNGGNETVYGFHRYSTRRSIISINGEGQFYALVDTPEKIISDMQKVIAGIEIDAFTKN